MTPNGQKRGDGRPDHSQEEGSQTRVRLQKAMAKAGLGSRRACERMIEDGMVSVNGAVVRELPVMVDPDEDLIEVRGLELPRGRKLAQPGAKQAIYVMLYKPRKTLTTLHDPEGRRTVADLVDHPSGARLYPVGRLDYDTMGLVLMTNDGEIANKLTHPSYGVHKTYRAIVKGSLSDEDVEELERGIYLAERKSGRTVGAQRTRPARLKIIKREPTRTILDVTLTEGRNRQVRRMLANAGCPVRKLVRTHMGPIRLKGLALGRWRELTPQEVQALKRAATRGERTRRKSRREHAS